VPPTATAWISAPRQSGCFRHLFLSRNVSAGMERRCEGLADGAPASQPASHRPAGLMINVRPTARRSMDLSPRWPETRRDEARRGVDPTNSVGWTDRFPRQHVSPPRLGGVRLRSLLHRRHQSPRQLQLVRLALSDSCPAQHSTAPVSTQQ
jgi:hypothetical protein